MNQENDYRWTEHTAVRTMEHNSHRRAILAVLLASLTAVAAILVLEGAHPAGAATAPPGFADELVAGVSLPTALAFTPDGRMLVTTQKGRLRVYENGRIDPDPALRLGDKVCTDANERGLLGAAVDPEFASNKFVYLYYTRNEAGKCVNRVQRYTLSDGNVARSSKLLLKSVPSVAGNHNGGDLHFGKDGYLYVTIGDGGTDYRGDSGSGSENDASRDRNVVLGKILRITRGGDVPPTNPFTGPDTGRCADDGRIARGKTCQETFAMGLRNPFRFAFDPNAPGTRFFINDVGQNAWEEIDESQAGADYAWNLCEGTHDNPESAGSRDCSMSPLTPPIHEYDHDSGCRSITGGAFVPDGIGWPAEYDGSYLFGDFACGKIFKLDAQSGGGYARTEFVTDLGQRSAVHMAFGPYADGQALYYTTYADGGEVRRISYSEIPPNPCAGRARAAC